KFSTWLLPRIRHPKKLAPYQTMRPNNESLHTPTLQPTQSEKKKEKTRPHKNKNIKDETQDPGYPERTKSRPIRPTSNTIRQEKEKIR
ncbi:22490_t:CDS:2, partial [Gigaspora rosea]